MLAICLLSAAFCEKHLKLLFTILEKSPEPVIRSNMVVAVGDLVVRFPNLLYSWTDKIFAQYVPLRSFAVCVGKRKSTLLYTCVTSRRSKMNDMGSCSLLVLLYEFLLMR